MHLVDELAAEEAPEAARLAAAARWREAERTRIRQAVEAADRAETAADAARDDAAMGMARRRALETLAKRAETAQRRAVQRRREQDGQPD